MKTIAIVSKEYGNGGVEKALVNMLNHIDYSRYSVDLIVPDYNAEVYPPNVNLIKTQPSIGAGQFSYMIRHPFRTYTSIYILLTNIIIKNRSYIDQLINIVWLHRVNNKEYDLAIAYDGPLGYSIFYTL